MRGNPPSRSGLPNGTWWACHLRLTGRTELFCWARAIRPHQRNKFRATGPDESGHYERNNTIHRNQATGAETNSESIMSRTPPKPGNQVLESL